MAGKWEIAGPGWNYSFPRDHGPHVSYRTEWWYATGNLRDDKEEEFGFQLTFFRQGIHPGQFPPNRSAFRVKDLPFAHFTVSDIGSHTFRFFEASSRGTFDEAGFGTPPGPVAWIKDWRWEGLPDGSFHLAASGEGRAVDLRLEATTDPLVHGHDGFSPKSPDPIHASHYYSMTRLRASGTVTVDKRVHHVSGWVWFDHEWSTDSLGPGEAGWDWAGLHLTNGDDVMLFRIRNQEGGTFFVSGTLRDREGRVSELKDLSIMPVGIWKSPATGGAYPAALKVSIPSRDLELVVTPKLADQELRLPPFAYWEGAVRAEGAVGGTKVNGEGYLELTGYGGAIRGLNGN